MATFLSRNPIGRLPAPVLAIVLQRVFQALDYLHNHCHLVHTDVKADNIMFGIGDDKTLYDFEEAEVASPTPRKELGDGRVIYVSRTIDRPSKIRPPVLCDLGSAFPGDTPRMEDVQPDQYRSPEMILGIPWSYRIDVWSVGCMIWDLFEAKMLFRGRDPEHNTYRGRAHLAEIISVLGFPKLDLIQRGDYRSKFFADTGEWNAGIELRPPQSLETLETTLQGEDKELFLKMVRAMLQWAAEDRKTPSELANDPWIVKQLS
ncbi:Serine/threonine-protein kinase SRPK [Ceratocystis platani]|uniref:Serine/threonine-protein kinase SRPK n=1 Tax=Ceratocystis fimbriata f. sp. platani TaxID=88771 RepID=A0A0F8BVM7_CERFI|nr:Serine/threonine-protein kinase SRPK [Ceratocystis platani]